MEYEDKVSIATPEGIEIELPLAGIGSRLAARIIDRLIQLTIAALFLWLYSRSVDTSSLGDALVAIIAIVIGFGVLFIYDVVFEAFGGGRTPGKRAVGLRVVGSRGEPVGLAGAAVRNLLRFVDEYLTLWIVALISMARSERNQRVGDMAAGTMVVRERSTKEAGADLAIGLDSLGDVEEAATWDTTGITDDELAAARRFLERRHEIEPQARARLAAGLRDRLQPKVPGADGTRSAEQFVELLVAVKSRRA